MNYVYLIVNIVNDKMYIGFTTQTTQIRLSKHFRDAKSGRDTHLCRAIRKHGEENFQILVLSTFKTKTEALIAEKRYIDIFGLKEHGYNMTSGGEGTFGHRHSNETKNKMSISHKGKTHSAETRRLLSLSRMGPKNPNYSKKYSTEERLAISAKTSGSLNPRAKSFLITFPDGTSQISNDRKNFCEEHNLKYFSVASACRQGKPYKGYYFQIIDDKGSI